MGELPTPPNSVNGTNPARSDHGRWDLFLRWTRNLKSSLRGSLSPRSSDGPIDPQDLVTDREQTTDGRGSD